MPETESRVVARDKALPRPVIGIGQRTSVQYVTRDRRFRPEPVVVMNHVPPVFGRTTIAGVVAQAGHSLKLMLERLEGEARPIADLHTHYLTRARERSCPAIRSNHTKCSSRSTCRK